MNTNPAVGHAGQPHLARRAKTAALCFGLAAVVYAAFTPVGHPLPFLRAASALALAQRSAPADPATAALDPGAAAWQRQAGSLPVGTYEQTGGPRECRLDAGIDTACTFN